MQQTILDYVRDEYLDEDDEDAGELKADTPLISSGIVDSFSMVSLKTFLESTYDIVLPDEEATPEAFDSVEAIVRLVQKHLGAKGVS